MAAHEAYLTHSTIVCARSIRAQSTAPHRRSCTASTPAPHGRRALRSKKKMSFEQGALLGQRISIAKRSPCRFGHSQSESFVAVYRAEHEFTQDM